jgi:hypothetical protein
MQMYSEQHIKDTGIQTINHTSKQKRAIKIIYTGKTQCKVQLRVRIIHTSEIRNLSKVTVQNNKGRYKTMNTTESNVFILHNKSTNAHDKTKNIFY